MACLSDSDHDPSIHQFIVPYESKQNVTILRKDAAGIRPAIIQDGLHPHDLREAVLVDVHMSSKRPALQSTPFVVIPP
jgi:hypothetical protein